MTEPTPEAPQGQDSAVKAVLSAVASVGVPVTLISAMMLYFGWSRADQQARYMGLDVSLFGYTTQDYIMRSISTLFMPLLWLAILGLAWLGLHQAVSGWLAAPRLRPRLRVAGRIVFGAGLLTAALALLASTASGSILAGPLALAAGTAVAAYGLWLARAAAPQSDRRRVPLGQRALRVFFLAGIIALAMVWELSNYAGVIGRGHANRLAQNVPTMPRATAFSTAPLGVDAPGVREELVGHDPPLYRTTGMRLLARSGGRIFLLHDGWTPQRGRVIVVPDGEGVSWEFSR